MKLEILYEDAYLLACVKPYGVLSQGDKGNDEDMITKIKHYLYDQEESEQAEEPYVAAIHRLDRPVGGVMVFAKTPEVAAKFSDMQQDGEIAKYYQAVITGELPDFEGEMVDYLLRDGKTNTTKVVKKGEKGAKRAELYYEVLDVMDTDDGTLSYVLIELVTGRHHQIRVQMAHAQMPLLGDNKYASRDSARLSEITGICHTALLASRLILKHPVSGKKMEYTLPFPKEWNIK